LIYITNEISYSMVENRHLEFNSFQTRAIIESNRAQITTNKYIELLQNKIKELLSKSEKLREQASHIDCEIESINTTISEAMRDAKENYKETFDLVIKSFDPPDPPWTANLILEDGIPVGADLTIPIKN